MLLDNMENFLKKLLADIKQKGIDVTNLEMDHIGYQASSSDDYEKLLKESKLHGELLSEEVVGGRRVAIFKLEPGIKYKNYNISAFELIEPKSDQNCVSALEHAEFIVDDFDSFMKMYPSIEWDISAIEQKDFPMIKLKLSKNTQVKFHLENVLNIVRKKHD